MSAVAKEILKDYVVEGRKVVRGFTGHTGT